MLYGVAVSAKDLLRLRGVPCFSVLLDGVGPHLPVRFTITRQKFLGLESVCISF